MLQKKIGGVLMLIFGLVFLFMISVHVYAADNTVKIYLGDSKVPRHHKALVEEGKSEELSFELKEGKVKSNSFKSDNEKAFKITSSNGKQYIEAIKEGTGYVILTIKTKDKKTYTEKLFISVYKKVEKCYGIAQTKIDVYRGASENADVENEDKKGEVAKNKKFYIIGLCEDFYLIQTIDGSKFDDNYDSGFVRKKNIKVPVLKIVLNKTKLSLFKDQEYKLTATVLPEFTTESKKVTWSTSDKNIIAIYNDGAIYVKKAGFAKVAAKCGGVVNCCNLTLKDNSSLLKINSKKKIKSPIIRTYRYSFLNNSDAFGNEYVLSRKLRKKLASNLCKLGYFSSIKNAEIAINKLLAEKWGGSCYGISVTTALNKKKFINVREYTKTKDKGYKMHKVSTPIKNRRTANIINYYFASQTGFNKDEYVYRVNDESVLYDKTVRKALDNFVRQAKKKIYSKFYILFN